MLFYTINIYKELFSEACIKYGSIGVHYAYNGIFDILDDFKFK